MSGIVVVCAACGKEIPEGQQCYLETTTGTYCCCTECTIKLIKRQGGKA